ncbi:MAG: Co2+/Mg2+ efflux protein ApaG [Hyphomonadaceae bacterium]|nr:Co2+/Mg2+ efflux protein ApaG [Hyphomonadaceae bacterium]
MSFEAETARIHVRVEPSFLAQESDPAESRFLWAYTIEIENRSDALVQLISRHWRITDANGMTQEVKGPGVVGEQPVLQPGESFTYTSGCPLATSSGLMVGSYQMIRLPTRESFEIAIPAFALDSPFADRRAN